jgi:predicted metal-dependent phosphoesterase TrpH
MQENSLIRVDLHTHTSYSADATTSPLELVCRARAAGLKRVAITDHGAIAGALEGHSIDPQLVIPGEEMKCGCGTHIIGLFLGRLIPNGLSVEETVNRIRDQGGVVYAPHPYAYLRNPSSRAASAIAVADVVEVFNARAFVKAWNQRASAAARAVGLPEAVGSDAHFGWEIGRVYTEMPDFTDAQSFLARVGEARPGRLNTTTPLIHAASISVEAVKRVLRRRRAQAG